MCACVMARIGDILERVVDQKPIYQLEWPNIRTCMLLGLSDYRGPTLLS